MIDYVLDRWPKIHVATQPYIHKGKWTVRKVQIDKPLPAKALRNFLVHNHEFDPHFSIDFLDELGNYVGVIIGAQPLPPIGHLVKRN